MRFFKRNRAEKRLVPCPRCSQLVPADAVECDMCGLDLRERDPQQPAPTERSEATH
jgi:hypothetical protein